MSNVSKIFLFLILICQIDFAQDNRTLTLDFRTKKLPFGLEAKVALQKPVVALALSGGGSRGLAQIGVLKALEDNGISFDIIAGTSMGSIVGGLYSAGYQLNQLDSIIAKTDWDFLLSLDRVTNRRDLFVDQKVSEDRAIFALRLKGLSPVFPTSINNGLKLSNFLNVLSLQAPIHVDRNFDDLLTKYRAVCTNLVTGNAEVLSKGSLSHAMRASSSVSFLLSPVRIDSSILVDGGLVANIPVRVAKSLGPDYVIAVNATSALAEEKSLEYPWIVADQLVSIPMKLLNQNQLKAANHIIDLPLPDRTSNDFSNLGRSVDDGYYYSLPHIKQLKADLDSIFMSRLTDKEFFVKNVSFRSEAQNFEIPYQIKYSKMDSVSSREILKDLAAVADRGDVEKISANISFNGSYSQIEFNAVFFPVVKSVDIYGVTLFDKNDFQSIFRGIENKPYNSRILLKKLLAAINVYRNAGYCFAEIDTVYFDSFTGKITLRINEGQVSQIVIEGNRSAKQTIITREIPKSNNGFYTISDIQESFTNLRSTNLFEDIYISERKNGELNNLVVKVIEKTSSLMRFGFKFDNENSVQLSMDVRDENMFGSGTELGSILLLGSRARSFILEQKANRVFKTYLTYKINAFYKLNDVDTYKDDPQTSSDYFSRSKAGEYRQIFYGLSLAIGAQAGRFGNFMVKGSYQRDEVKNIQNSTVDPYKTDIASLKGILTIDTQDKYPYPTKGVYFTGFYETAQTILGGDVGYTSFGFDYKNYFTLFQDHTITPRISMGFADKTLPLSEQFSLGGLNSFYGMRDNEYRGRQIFLTSLEYRYKLHFIKICDTYFLTRYDLGSTWNVQNEIRFKDLRHGVGAALSFDTPIGPADFAVGRTFEFTRGIKSSIVKWPVSFYFSIGFYY